MNLLAIDTSTELASVALLVGTDISSDEQGSQKTHAQLLLPMIDRLLVDSGIGLHQLNAIIFGCGPGSFTGLRIACSIAKGLAYAHDIGLTPVSSLGTIAFAARQNLSGNTPVLALLDARMKELYWSYFPANEDVGVDAVSPASAIEIPGVNSLALAGVGIDSYWSELPDAIKKLAPKPLNLYPKAACMIGLAQKAQLPTIAADKAQPVYVRNQITQGSTHG